MFNKCGCVLQPQNVGNATLNLKITLSLDDEKWKNKTMFQQEYLIWPTACYKRGVRVSYKNFNVIK